MELIDFIKINYPEIVEVYRRKTTPFYYETGVLYHPMRSGFGCIGGSKKPLKIIKATYTKDIVYLHLVDDKGDKYSVTLDEAPTSIKRLDDSIAPLGNIIPDTKEIIYLTHNNIDYKITQMYFRNYGDNRLNARVWVRRSCDKEINGKQPFFELYSVIGKGKLNLCHTKSYDSIGRDNSDYKFNISVRQFK